MGTHKIYFYKEVDKNYTGCNLKTTKLLDCALIGVCAVIGSNTVNIVNQDKNDTDHPVHLIRTCYSSAHEHTKQKITL